MSRRLAAFAARLALVCVLPTAALASPLDPYLPKSGVIEGHVMKLDVAPEDQAIDRKFRTAVAGNMDWFKKAITSLNAGQTLPYDRRMGISEAQYVELKHMKADFAPVSPIRITVARDASGTLTFASADPAAAGLDEVRFAADAKAAETPFGKLDVFNAIHQDDARAPIGVWSGAEWARVAPHGADTPSAKIAFGKREPSGEGVLYYQVASYGAHKEQSLVVFYKLD